jgi:5-methylcytosine-specific restriction endonuclease McrA
MSGFVSFFKTLDYTFWKAGRKRDKRLMKARADRHKRLEQSLATDRIRREVFSRDQGRCRVCQTPVLLYTSDDFRLMHAHHVVYASAGGSDEPINRCALCLECHAKEHGQRLSIEGLPEEVLTVTFRDVKTGVVLDVRRSPCPA